LVVTDTLYEVYLEKKREMKRQLDSGDGRRIVSHFSINEDDMDLFELFGDNKDMYDVENEPVLADEE
jgi:hypothetical protein